MKNLVSANTVVIENDYTLLSQVVSTRQKNKNISDMNQIYEQVHLMDVYRVFHSTASEYPFFSAVHGILSNIDQIQAHRTRLSKCRAIEIILCILSNHSAMKLEINSKRNHKDSINTWKLNNILVNHQWSQIKLKKKLNSIYN